LYRNKKKYALFNSSQFVPNAFTAIKCFRLKKIVGRYIFKIKIPKTEVKEEISRPQKD